MVRTLIAITVAAVVMSSSAVAANKPTKRVSVKVTAKYDFAEPGKRAVFRVTIRNNRKYSIPLRVEITSREDGKTVFPIILKMKPSVRFQEVDKKRSGYVWKTTLGPHTAHRWTVVVRVGAKDEECLGVQVRPSSLGRKAHACVTVGTPIDDT